LPDFFTGAAFLIVFLGATFAGAAFLGAGAAFLKSALTWRVAIFVRKVGVGRESLCVRE
jgi:hypothetical protein